MKNRTSTIALALALLASGKAGLIHTAAHAQTKTTTAKSFEVDVPATKEWVDTNIDVRGGAKLRFTATGQITYPADESYGGKLKTAGTFGPDGLPRGFADLVHEYAVGSAGHGALIGRIGSESYAQAFLVGASKEYEVPVAGRLFLGINQSAKDASVASGSFQVKVEVLDEGSSEAVNAGGPAETRVSGITPDLLSKIPRRVSDPENNPGDMVNVLIVGTQDQLVQVFTNGGWVQVDKTVRNTAMNAVFESFEKKDYLTMPMSVLYLFKTGHRITASRTPSPSESRCHGITCVSGNLRMRSTGGRYGAWQLRTILDSSGISATTVSRTKSTPPSMANANM